MSRLTWSDPGPLHAAELAKVGLFLTVVAVFVTWPQVTVMSTSVSDLGDPLLNSWTLAWVAHTLPQHLAHVFDANIFYPEHNTLAYSETLIVPALMVAPVFWLGGNPLLAHNVLLLMGYVLSGVAVYVLMRSLAVSRGAALVAGTLFAVYPYRIEEYPKVQLQLTFWMPLALWAVHRLQLRATLGRGSLAGLFVALQAYSCLYYGIFAAVPLACVAVVTIVAAPRDNRWSIARALTAGAVLAVVLCLPLMHPYRAAARVVGERTREDVTLWSAEPVDFLQAHPDNAMYGNPSHPGHGEKRMFPGLVAPALGLAALAPPVSTVVAAYLATGVVSADLALGFHGVGYDALYTWVPPFRALRVPARFAMVLGLALSVLAGFGVERLGRGRRAGVQMAIVAAAIGSGIAENRPHALELREVDDLKPVVYQWLAEQPLGVVCEYPVHNLQGRIGPQDATYTYYSTIHWKPLVNGYSGFQPPSYNELVDKLGDFPSDASILYLRRRGVKYLLVHNAFGDYIRGDFEEFVRVLKDRSDLQSVGRFAWRGGGFSEAFRVK